MKVARKHIIAAVESGRLLSYPRYMIKAYPFNGKIPSIAEFGWTISVIPKKRKMHE